MAMKHIFVINPAAGKANAFEMIRSECFWLSSHPSVPGSVYEGSDQSGCPRIATAVVLQPIDGGYLIRGDNCYADENIPEKDVIGVLSEFFRNDKHYYCTDKKYLRYAKRRIKTYKFRRFWVMFFVYVKAAIKRVLRLLGIKKGTRGTK